MDNNGHSVCSHGMAKHERSFRHLSFCHLEEGGFATSLAPFQMMSQKSAGPSGCTGCFPPVACYWEWYRENLPGRVFVLFCCFLRFLRAAGCRGTGGTPPGSTRSSRSSPWTLARCASVPTSARFAGAVGACIFAEMVSFCFPLFFPVSNFETNAEGTPLTSEPPNQTTNSGQGDFVFSSSPLGFEGTQLDNLF